MALPGSYKKKVNISRDRPNIEYPYIMESGAAENMKDMITDKDTYLPKGVMHIDLDAGFKDFVTENMALTLNGDRVPVFMMGIQKWTEFSKTWNFSDEYKNVKIPFVNIVRQPDTKPGSNPSLIYNIPQGKSFIYSEVPTWDGNRKGVDIYKIPQPIPIDINYDVRIFAYTVNHNSDYTVIAVVGVDEDNNYYILDIDRFKTNKISVMYDRAESVFRKWRFKKMRCEVVAAQRLIVTQFKDYMRSQNIVFTVEEYNPPRNMSKTERIAAILEPRYNNNQIWHYKGGNCQILEEELIMNNPEHDDVKDRSQRAAAR